MTKRERVLNAIAHKEGDRVPKGELVISGVLANKLLGRGYPPDYQHAQREKDIREFLNIDIINLGDWPADEIGTDSNGNRKFRSIFGEEYVTSGKSKHLMKPPIDYIEDACNYKVPDVKRVSGKIIEDFAAPTDLFVFGQLAGPVSGLNELFGMEDYMVYCMTNTNDVRVFAEKVMEFEIAKAKLFIDSGADGVIIADDIAFNSGTLLPPDKLDILAFPFYREAIREIKKYKDVPVFLHTDGYIMEVMDRIVEAGFDGLHSLQPSAGMDIARVKKDYGDALCLMGNIDLDYVMTFASPKEVEETVKRTIDAAAPGGGYIVSTCNMLVDVVSPENALAMYRTANEYGAYNK
jgi:uroporphyrinogen decarboxylase